MKLTKETKMMLRIGRKLAKRKKLKGKELKKYNEIVKEIINTTSVEWQAIKEAANDLILINK